MAQSGIARRPRAHRHRRPRCRWGRAGFTVASATADVTVDAGFATFTEAFQASAKATGTTYVADLAEREVKP